MAALVRTIFGGKSGSEKRAIAAQEEGIAAQKVAAEENRAVQQSAAAQQIQQQGQEQARLDGAVSAARKVSRGRRLLLDSGAGKTSLG